MAPGIFITATSTGAGKTVCSSALLRLAGRQGIRAVGLKPVASGSTRTGPDGALRNADALELQAAAPVALSYDDVNPYCFEPPIAPHLAAGEAGRVVTLEALEGWYRRVTVGADLAIVEGAGGWRVPLHPNGFLSDLPERLGLGVILVVGITLGCLNHARLTLEAITTVGRCPWLGWIANEVDPACERLDANVDTLTQLLDGPPLARIPHSTGPRSSYGNPLVDPVDESDLAKVLCAAYSR